MKKKTRIILASLMLMLIFGSLCFAEADEKMAMLPKKEANDIYNLVQFGTNDISPILANKKLSIEIGSITPIYVMDPLEYSRSGIIDLKRVVSEDAGECLYYNANLIDDSGNHAGFLRFCVMGETAYHRLSSYISDNSSNSFASSHSYADHAEQIRTLLNEENLISPADVKCVLISDIGEFFYVKNDRHDVFIQIAGSAPEKVISCERLKELADCKLHEYEDFISKKEQWEKEHPGETWNFDGEYGSSPNTSFLSRNVLDMDTVVAVTVITAVLAAAVTVFIVIKKKTASKKT